LLDAIQAATYITVKYTINKSEILFPRNCIKDIFPISGDIPKMYQCPCVMKILKLLNVKLTTDNTLARKCLYRISSESVKRHKYT
jgi:hypothetical protein